jgi:hypothetical protein
MELEQSFLQLVPTNRIIKCAAINSPLPLAAGCSTVVANLHKYIYTYLLFLCRFISQSVSQSVILRRRLLCALPALLY